MLSPSPFFSPSRKRTDGDGVPSLLLSVRGPGIESHQRVLGFRVLGFVGFRVLGFRGLGFRGLGFRAATSMVQAKSSVVNVSCKSTSKGDLRLQFSWSRTRSHQQNPKPVLGFKV